MLHEQRGRSSYVTLNLAWFIGVCFVCFVAGLVVMAMQDRQAVTESTVMTCDQCGKTLDAGDQGNVLLHEGCREAWLVAYSRGRAAGQAALAEVQRQGLAVVLRRQEEATHGNENSDN